MGKFEPSYSVPELEVIESQVTVEFQVYDHPVEIIATTGMVRLNAGWTKQPERVVCFEGVIYETESKESPLGTYEMFHLDVTLWPLPRWMKLIARLGNEEEPGSVEDFFYDFMFQLGLNADFYVDEEVVQDEFDLLAEKMMDSGGFAENGRTQNSWKPYCQIYSIE